ncbi:AI-2E family transporter [Pararhizobium sp.]|uniref:AI-2E family transporter n=1 Tax=Pararhizobium sp. TaxID=1977563 RepID=UPI00271E9648|nr:AI-2E family transporter [Pararhizobium sp.]MDO9418324.1 AI-2E family transporter [Pararhizobium sp.]
MGGAKPGNTGSRESRKNAIKNALVDTAEVSEALPAAQKDALDIAVAWSIIGLFIIIGSAAIHMLATVLMPITLAIVVGIVLGHAADQLGRFGVPPVAGGLILGLVFVISLFLLINAVVEPMTSLAGDAPAMLQRTLERLQPMLERFEWLKMAGLASADGKAVAEAAMQNAGPVLGMVAGGLTPALVQALIFMAALGLFLLGRANLRRALIMVFQTREDRLSVIRIINAIESALGFYFSTASLIYLVLGTITGLIAYFGGLQMAALWGLFAFVSSFIPFLGVALMTLALATAGLLTHDGIFAALAPAFLFFMLHLVMENLVTPSIMGRRLEINPFVIFIAIIFWTWMWGAVGAMLALPLCLIAMTIFDELMVEEEVRRLPG